MKDKIIDYVTQTPENTNPAVLNTLLKDLKEPSIDSADVVKIVKDEFAGGVGYVAGKEIVVVYPETQLDFQDAGGMELYLHQTTTNDFMLPVEGETYIVKWDGTEYEVICSSFNNDPFLGNKSMLGLTGGEEYPFAIIENSGEIGIATTEQAASHTISVIRKKITYSLINSNYLPVATNDSFGLVKDNKYIFDLTKEQTQATIEEWIMIAKDPTNELYYKLYEDTIQKAYSVSGYPTTHFRIGTSIYAYRTYTPNAAGLYDWKNWEDEWANCYASTLRLSASNYDKQLSVQGLKGWNIRNNSNLPYGYVGIAADSLMAQHYVQANAFIFDPGESTDYFTLAVDKDGNITLVKTRVSNDYELNTVQIPTSENMILKSSTEGSTKQFKITVDDSGTITATEVS